MLAKKVSTRGENKARGKFVAIAPFLRSCPHVTTLGVRASMADYTPEQRRALLSAARILFPTPRFAAILHAAGKKTFPSPFAYTVQKSRLIQKVLFQFLQCPHPFTRIYYGRQKKTVVEDFSFPLRAMGPKMSDNAFLVSDAGELMTLSATYNPLIIEEVLSYLQWFQLIFVNYEFCGVLGKVWTEEQGRFQSRLIPNFQHMDSDGHPLHLSREVAPYLERLLRSAQIDDIAVEIGLTQEGWRLIELTRAPLCWPTATGSANRFDLISRMIESNRL
jgi:hypothetical protein